MIKSYFNPFQPNDAYIEITHYMKRNTAMK